MTSWFGIWIPKRAVNGYKEALKLPKLVQNSLNVFMNAKFSHYLVNTVFMQIID